MKWTTPLPLALLLLAAPAAWAYPAHARLAIEAYGKRVSCELCHGYGGGTERTSFGKAWHQAGESLDAFAALDGKDSDGDGIANKEEIRVGSNPGDARSTPKDPGRYAQRQNKVFIPREQLDLVMPRMQRFDVVEPVLTKEQISTAERLIGRSLSPAERLLTVYFGVENDRRSAVSVFAYAEYKKRHYTLLVAMNTDGIIKRAAMFRGGDDSAVFRPYLDCFEGVQKNNIVTGKLLTCPKAAALESRKGELLAITSAVHAALSTVGVVFAEAK